MRKRKRLVTDRTFLLAMSPKRNNASTTVTSGVVTKFDYSTAAGPLALPDAWKPDLHPPERSP
ncbi:hypothetical protein Hanom_Chr06g00565451 [Helianthus anomalus]